ncbi:hypothetical protein GJV26_09110 [Massilia dura]|uniref:Uncharacterized protein n=1 Tax=Pseudoduganella dura TaxID=321982 RepID=A0A6I3XJ41_9BURK|nr:hypothetical protein [Pseudoduganella dura]MUI12628.1 hypothetical protein [Pseudoduganella dura]GGX96977.1 hypothetical protein GCM10007386_29950 [Pseudoduganella dura]
MTLPDLALQIVYGKVAWALVLVAMLAAFAARFLNAYVPASLHGSAPRRQGAAAAAVIVLASLPGEWSPAWWLTLAFQYPSGLLAGCALMSLLAARRQEPAPRFMLPLAVALPLVLIGVVLYLDTFGVVALGLYYGGFGAVGAPLLGCCAIAACAFAIFRGHAVQPALALMTGLLLHALLRLPTGNLWDALLDPLLWSWALVSSVVAGMRQAAGARMPALEPGHEPAPEPAMATALATPPVPAAVIEQLQTVRE